MSKEYLVNFPILDLRGEPQLPSSIEGRDPLQETQLLLGETVIVEEIQGEWARVTCPEQPFLQNGEWIGYPGWVRKEGLVAKIQAPNYTVQVPWVTVHGLTLSLGSQLFAEPTDGGHYRVQLPDGNLGLVPAAALTPPSSPFATARSFLGAPYLWGGRSAYQPGLRTSVDCSGFVSLVFGAHGKRLPRNASHQFAFCSEQKEPIPGDLVFLYSEQELSHIDHVMLYLGNNTLIEATARTGNVRLIDLESRLSKQRYTYGRP